MHYNDRHNDRNDNRQDNRYDNRRRPYNNDRNDRNDRQGGYRNKHQGNRSSGPRGGQPPRSDGVMVQDPYLNLLRKRRISLTLKFLDGKTINGTIDSFDRNSILLQHEDDPESLHLYYKQAIASVTPSHPVVRQGPMLVMEGDEPVASQRRHQNQPEPDSVEDDEWEDDAEE